MEKKTGKTEAILADRGSAANLVKAMPTSFVVVQTRNNNLGKSIPENRLISMAKKRDKSSANIERFLKQISTQRFTFKGSETDLELLRSLDEGTCANAKPGDASFHAYAAAVNVASEFATQALDLLELIPFNNQLAEIQEEYMPSYPPLSPVTSAFFAVWMVLDARDFMTGTTLGELLVHHLQQVGRHDYLRKAMVALNHSFCTFYEVTDTGSHGVTLWDIVGQREMTCWSSSGYPGRKGEIWYARVLPPFMEGATRSVVINTPYVFQEGSRRTWEDFHQRYLLSDFGATHSWRDYLKYGKSLGYWLEFVFQAFKGYTGNMILVTGVPDDPASLPHSHPKHRL